MGAFPPWEGGPRRSLRDAALLGGPVAGRYLRGTTRDLVEDASAVVEIEPAEPRPAHGDQVAGRLEPASPRARLHDVRVLAPSARQLPPELARIAARRGALEARARVIAAIRESFAARGFVEVETPARVVNPGLEPHLRPFPAGATRGEPRWLVTSPELHLKRLLAAGCERFFELARAFRDDEAGDLHVAEFLMLEWYRSHAGLDDLASDLAALLPAVAHAAGVREARGCDLLVAPETVTFAEVFERHAGVDGHGLAPAEREQRFAVEVQPRLGVERPTLVVDWPADAAALARLRVDAAGREVAARMELFVAGVELANGFDELNDPTEQRRRHEADRAARAAAGAAVPPLDEGFLAALEAGIPPSAGMALGVDRLVVLVLGASRIADIRLFSE